MWVWSHLKRVNLLVMDYDDKKSANKHFLHLLKQRPEKNWSISSSFTCPLLSSHWNNSALHKNTLVFFLRRVLFSHCLRYQRHLPRESPSEAMSVSGTACGWPQHRMPATRHYLRHQSWLPGQSELSGRSMQGGLSKVTNGFTAIFSFCHISQFHSQETHNSKNISYSEFQNCGHLSCLTTKTFITDWPTSSSFLQINYGYWSLSELILIFNFSVIATAFRMNAACQESAKQSATVTRSAVYHRFVKIGFVRLGVAVIQYVATLNRVSTNSAKVCLIFVRFFWGASYLFGYFSYLCAHQINILYKFVFRSLLRPECMRIMCFMSRSKPRCSVLLPQHLCRKRSNCVHQGAAKMLTNRMSGMRRGRILHQIVPRQQRLRLRREVYQEQVSSRVRGPRLLPSGK